MNIMRACLLSASLIFALPAWAGPPATDGTVYVTSDMAGSDLVAAGMDLEVLDIDGIAAPLSVEAVAGKGAVQNLKDVLYRRGIDVGLTLTDTLDYIRAQHLIPEADLAKLRLVAKLWDDEVHVLAGPGINSLQDLNDKRINVDVHGSSSDMMSQIILPALGIQADLRYDPQLDGWTKLQHGEIDALIQVGAAPVLLLGLTPAGSHLHFVPVPRTGPLGSYIPAKLSHDEYPTIVPAGVEPVPTIAVGELLATYDFAPNTARYENVRRFVTALFGHISELQRPPRHPKWREVNLAADVPGWRRFGEAQLLLDRMQEKSNLAAFINSRSDQPLTQEQVDQLFTGFERLVQQRQASAGSPTIRH